jgi:hypothetical protein
MDIQYCWVFGRIAVKSFKFKLKQILWSSLFDTSNVNKTLMSNIHDNFKFFLSKIWQIQFLINIESSTATIVLLASEGCLNRDHIDLLLLYPAPEAGIYDTAPPV